MYHTCYKHKGFIRHRGPMTENERERGTDTAKIMHYLPRKFCSSVPEGMLVWKSIFLSPVSSSNIMRWPLDKAPKLKHSGKRSHTKVISLTGLNHSVSKKKRRRRTEDTRMPVFERRLLGDVKLNVKPKVRSGSWREQICSRTRAEQYFKWVSLKSSKNTKATQL